MALVFISSPFSSLKAKDAQERLKKAREIAIKHSKKIIQLRNDLTPISPVLLFTQFLDEKTQRNYALIKCLDLLLNCEYFYYTSKRHLHKSEGMKMEYKFAIKHKKKFLSEI